MDAFFFESKTRDAPSRRAVLASMVPHIEAMERGGVMAPEEVVERLEKAIRMSWAVEVVALRAKGPRELETLEDLRNRFAAVVKELRRAANST